MEREFTKQMQVETHLHTDASLSDGAESFVTALSTAKERGLKAIAITNHGNAADLVHAWHYLDEYPMDIQLIFGVEAYIRKDQNLYGNEDKATVVRQHLVLLARTNAGYQDFCRFISDTERNKDAKGFSVGTIEMLKKHFGGKDGIICSTACFAGPIAYELLYNHKIDKEISKIQGRIDRSVECLGSEYKETREKVIKVESEISKIDEEIEKLDPIARKTFSKAKKTLKGEKDLEIKEKLQAELDVEIIQSKEAKERIKELKDQKKALKVSICDEKKYLTSKKNSVQTIEANEELIKILNSNKRTEEEMYKNAKKEAEIYLGIFGRDNFYIELMYHGWKEEAYVAPKLVQIAKELGIKTIATNDVHMALKSDFKTREYVRNIAGISQKRDYQTLSKEDEELYIKTAEEKYEMLCQVIKEPDAYEAIVNSGKMVDKIEFFDISAFGKHYPSFKHADDSLKELAETGQVVAELKDGREIEIEATCGGIKKRYGKKWDNSYQERFNYELGIISQMGFSSYFLYIADVICKCKHLYGMPIGPGRGSGAGSIVCYLSGITELDPISLNLLFERFLNPHRVSMPDIDTDFSKEAREYAIKYVTEFYGAKKVAGIMTMAKMGPKDALTYGPKIYAKSIGVDQKTFNGIGAEMRALVGDAKSLSEIEEMIQSKYSNNESAMMIWDAAKRLEGTIKSYGQHAAGVISIMENDVEDFIPLMMASDDEGNDKMVIQADMIAAEANLGFIKFDFLGLKNLNVITACQKLIEERFGMYIDMYKLPVDDARVYREFANANTNFVFQFESDGMKGMLKQLNPTRFGDLVLAVSVYRPGPMQFIDSICKCKRTGTKSEILQKFPVLDDVLEETYGFPVYQEQVMKIMTVCAGFDLGHADNVRRFMSKKKKDKLADEKPAFIDGCVKTIGSSEEDAKWLFEQLMPFAAYGFNKSHAAAYSLVSYITAWLKLYYPEEYLCCAMLEQGEKTLQFLNECKNSGIEVMPVSVNDSAVNYTVESKGKVRIGLSAIKGLKTESEKIISARNGKTFVSIEDFIKRCNIKINSIEACILSGACDELVKNRDIAFEYAKEYRSALDLMDSTRSKIAELEAVLNSDLDEKAKTSKEKQLKSWVTKFDSAKDTMNSLQMPTCFELSNREKCAYELKYLGMFIGKSPLDDFDVMDPKYTNLEKAVSGDKITCLGVVFDYHQIKTKNGDDMAFFKIIDKDSIEMDCVLFPRAFESLDNEIEDNAVIELNGRMSENQNEEPQIEVWKISAAEKTNQMLLIDANDLELLENVIIPKLPKYRVKNGGIKFYLANCMGALREGAFAVSKEIITFLDEQNVNYLVQ